MLEQALKEQGIETFNTAEGFFTYKPQQEQDKKFIQVVSAYLKPECRNAESGKKMLEALEGHVKQDEVSALAWATDMRDPNKENQLLMCLSLGFKVQNASPERLVLLKQV